jgi:hypothetical protein
MYTFKVEHKFTDKVSLSAFYLYNKTDEPGTRLVKDDKSFIADQDQWFGPLRRRPHVLVFNNTNVINNTTGPDAALRLDHVAGLVRSAAVLGRPAVARLQLVVCQRATGGR